MIEKYIKRQYMLARVAVKYIELRKKKRTEEN